MALDRFVNGCKRPVTRPELQSLLEDFFGPEATIRWDKDRFFVTLGSRVTCPLRRLMPESSVVKAFLEEPPQERALEVWLSTGSWVDGSYYRPGTTVDVIARHTDSYTNSLAAGLAQWIANYWEGTLETDG